MGRTFLLSTVHCHSLSPKHGRPPGLGLHNKPRSSAGTRPVTVYQPGPKFFGLLKPSFYYATRPQAVGVRGNVQSRPPFRKPSSPTRCLVCSYGRNLQTASVALRNPPLQGLGGQRVVCVHIDTHGNSRATKPSFAGRNLCVRNPSSFGARNFHAKQG